MEKSQGPGSHVVVGTKNGFRPKLFQNALHGSYPAQNGKVPMSFHEPDAAAGGQTVHESTPTLDGVQMGFRAVDQGDPLISEPPEELRDDLPPMKVVHVDIIGGVSKARRP